MYGDRSEATLATINAGARIFFAMGRHGILHSALGRAHRSNQTPHDVTDTEQHFSRSQYSN